MKQDLQHNDGASAPARNRVFGIAGHSGMGKTTLLERLLPELRARGLSVSLIKHSHKDIEIDRPGKDSYRLREAGCHEVLLLGRQRWALMHELRGADEPPLDYLLDRLQADMFGELPADPQQAEAQVRQIMTSPAWQQKQLQLNDSYRQVVRAWELGDKASKGNPSSSHRI